MFRSPRGLSRHGRFSRIVVQIDTTPRCVIRCILPHVLDTDPLNGTQYNDCVPHYTTTLELRERPDSQTHHGSNRVKGMWAMVSSTIWSYLGREDAFAREFCLKKFGWPWARTCIRTCQPVPLHSPLIAYLRRIPPNSNTSSLGGVDLPDVRRRWVYDVV